MVPPVSPRSVVSLVDAPPTMEELWEECDQHLKLMLPPEVKAKQLSKKEEVEAKEAER